MRIKEAFEGDVAILTIAGNMMGGPESQKFHQKIKSLVDDGVMKVIVDLHKVKWMNSSGLGILMSGYGSMKNVGGNLKIAGAGDKLQSIFMMTKLNNFFESYESVDRALVSFA
ncbi:MAG: anti-sigma factor antagonist [Calditrichaeota bacterium]|nr:MAG: anti-sigma factor antagonist [Calditrichota bacterium]